MNSVCDDMEPEVPEIAFCQAKSPRVSVVIPVYNVERYLRECLDSIVNQTLRDIEIICVDDGSTDGSAAILAEYAAKDSRIRVLSQTNRGLSSARNAGMSNAKGEYIYFIDSDDWIEENALEHLLRIADGQSADQVIFSAHVFCDEDYDGEDAQKNLEAKERYYHVAPQIAQKPMSGIELMRNMLDSHAFFVTVMMRFFRLSALRKEHITFPDGYLHEDEYFSPVSLVNAGKALAITERFYHRRLRANSIVTSKDLLGERLRGYLSVARLLKAYAESHCADGSEGKRLLMSRSNVMRVVARNFSEGMPPEELPDDCKNALISIYREDRLTQTKAEKNARAELAESKKRRGELFTKLQEAQKARGELFTKLQEAQKARGCPGKNTENSDKDLDKLRRNIAALEKQVRGLKFEVDHLKTSEAYRTGMFITWPARKAWGGVKCLRENGFKYTVKHAIGKVMRLFGSKIAW